MSPEEYAEKAAELDLDRGKLTTGFKADIEEPPKQPGPEAPAPVDETNPEPKLVTVPGIQAFKPEKPKPASQEKPIVKKRCAPAPVAKPIVKERKQPPLVIGPLWPGISDDQLLSIAYSLCDTQGWFTEEQLVRVLGELSVSGEIGLCLLNNIIEGDIFVQVCDNGVRFSNKARPLDRSLLTPGTVLKYTMAGCIHCEKSPLERVTFVRWENKRTSVWLRVKDAKGHWHGSKYAADYLDFLSYCAESTGSFMNEDYAI